MSPGRPVRERWPQWAPAAAVSAVLFATACLFGSSTGEQGPPPTCGATAPGSTSLAGSPASGPVLEQVADVPLPGAAVRFDYQSLDTAANRLYISHMSAGQMVVFDIRTQQVIAVVDSLPVVTGVLVVPELGKVYASVTGGHYVAVIDAVTLKVVARPGPIEFPDGIAYAPTQRKIYVSDESGKKDLVIDGRTDQVVTNVTLGGEAGNTIYDAGSGCVLVAAQTVDQIVAIDPATDRVVGRYGLGGAAHHPHGLYVDAPRRMLFVANQSGATVLAVDLRTMSVLGTQPVGGTPDVLAFDYGWQRLYVASEAGVVSAFTEQSAGLAHNGDVTLPNAHTVAVDPRTHLVYLPLQNVGGSPVLRIMSGPPPAGP